MASKRSTTSTESPKKRVRLVDQVLPEAKKKFGSDSVSLDGLSEISYYVDTCNVALTHAIGRPGYPAGRLTVIQGKESSGKTSIVLEAMGKVQAAGGVCIYLECEQALEADRAAQLGLYTDKYVDKLGLDVEPLVILNPEHIKQAFAMIEFYIKKFRAIAPDVPIVICWDSVAATPSMTEASDANEEYSAIAPGEAARQVSAGFRRLTRYVSRYQVVLICLNFLKEKIGQSFPGASNVATIAQRPLGQHASIRIELVNMGTVGKKKSESTGIKVLAKVTKNKIAPPFREALFEFIFNKGTNNNGWLLDAAKSRGIIKGSGAYLSYGDEKFQRREWPDQSFYQEVVDKVKAALDKETQDLLGSWQPPKDDDEEDDDEFTDERPKRKKVEEEDDD